MLGGPNAGEKKGASFTGFCLDSIRAEWRLAHIDDG